MAEKWMFVVDTEEYSGNFERELTAFMTGIIPQREGHGDKEAAMFEKELGEEKVQEMEDLVSFEVNDDDDVPEHMTCCLVSTPGMFNDGFGGHFKDGEERQALKHYNSEADKREKIALSDIANLKKYPCYCSVGVHLSRRPTDEEIQFFKDRAKQFSKLPKENSWDHRPKITGFRLVKTITQSITEEKWKNED